jgi:hypothetical protein
MKKMCNTIVIRVLSFFNTIIRILSISQDESFLKPEFTTLYSVNQVENKIHPDLLRGYHNSTQLNDPSLQLLQLTLTLPIN